MSYRLFCGETRKSIYGFLAWTWHSWEYDTKTTRLADCDIVAISKVGVTWEVNWGLLVWSLMSHYRGHVQPVNLPNHTFFLGRRSPLSGLPVLGHIVSPETDNCPTWISKRKKNVENMPWSVSVRECLVLDPAGIKSVPSDHQADAYLTEPPEDLRRRSIWWQFCNIFSYFSIKTCTHNLTLVLLNKLRCHAQF